MPYPMGPKLSNMVEVLRIRYSNTIVRLKTSERKERALDLFESSLGYQSRMDRLVDQFSNSFQNAEKTTTFNFRRYE